MKKIIIILGIIILFLSGCVSTVKTTIWLNSDKSVTTETNITIDQGSIDEIDGGADKFIQELQKRIPAGSNISRTSTGFNVLYSFKTIEEFNSWYEGLSGTKEAFKLVGNEDTIFKNNYNVTNKADFELLVEEGLLKEDLETYLIDDGGLRFANIYVEEDSLSLTGGIVGKVGDTFREISSLQKLEYNYEFTKDGNIKVNGNLEIKNALYSKDTYENFFEKYFETKDVSVVLKEDNVSVNFSNTLEKKGNIIGGKNSPYNFNCTNQDNLKTVNYLCTLETNKDFKKLEVPVESDLEGNSVGKDLYGDDFVALNQNSTITLNGEKISIKDALKEGTLKSEIENQGVKVKSTYIYVLIPLLLSLMFYMLYVILKRNEGNFLERNKINRRLKGLTLITNGYLSIYLIATTFKNVNGTLLSIKWYLISIILISTILLTILLYTKRESIKKIKLQSINIVLISLLVGFYSGFGIFTILIKNNLILDTYLWILIILTWFIYIFLFIYYTWKKIRVHVNEKSTKLSDSKYSMYCIHFLSLYFVGVATLGNPKLFFQVLAVYVIILFIDILIIFLKLSKNLEIILLLITSFVLILISIYISIYGELLGIILIYVILLGTYFIKYLLELNKIEIKPIEEYEIDDKIFSFLKKIFSKLRNGIKKYKFF